MNRRGLLKYAQPGDKILFSLTRAQAKDFNWQGVDRYRDVPRMCWHPVGVVLRVIGRDIEMQVGEQVMLVPFARTLSIFDRLEIVAAERLKRRLEEIEAKHRRKAARRRTV